MKWLSIVIMMTVPAGAAGLRDLQLMDAAALAGEDIPVPAAKAGPALSAERTGIENLSDQEWLLFVQTVREREYDDDHLTDEERDAVLKEWVRRNPADKEKLTGHLHIDFVNLVLVSGLPGRSSERKASSQPSAPRAKT